MKSTDAGFGEESEDVYGYLTTTEQFDAKAQEETGGKYFGKYPSFKGSYCDYYTDLVAAINGKAELVVKAQESRDGIRVIELARESADKGVTLPWS